jgi:hypothetical protein
MDIVQRHNNCKKTYSLKCPVYPEKNYNKLKRNIFSIFYLLLLVGRSMKSLQLFFLISYQFFPLFSEFSSTWLKLLVLGHPTGLFPLKFNYTDHLCVLVLSIFLHSQNSGSNFSSISVNKFWIPILRSRVRFPVRSLGFSIDLILSAALWPWG